MAKYIELKDLKVYQLARKLSELAWPLYTRLDFDSKKTIGNQFIRAVDSIGANIAEGYNRYHHLDRVKFYYYSRGSLSEAISHWAELMLERKLIKEYEFKELDNTRRTLEIKLNKFISSTLKAKK